MVSFSFHQAVLESRVMKERSWPSSPLTGAKRAILPTPYLVGQTCRFAPIKKLPCLPMLPSKNPYEPSPFPKTQPGPGVLHFLSVSTGCPSVVENSGIQRHAGNEEISGGLR